MAGALAPFLTAGDEVVALPDMSAETMRYFTDVLPRQGIAVRWAASLNADDVAACVGPKTRLIYAETPTNPLVRVVDLPALSAIARKAGLLLAVDGTLGGPLNQRPLQLGADILIHSMSKYLNGHGDLIAGAVVGGRKITKEIRSLQQTSGAILDPFGAWLLLRGMTTYALRMAQHNRSGMAIAAYLAGHSKVIKVHYPGLPEHPDNLIATQQMKAFGGLVSFEVATDEEARRIVDGCRIFRIGPSVGGIESLVSQPGNTSHHSVPLERRRSMGISDGLVRLSVGIEATDDLLEDLDHALGSL